MLDLFKLDKKSEEKTESLISSVDNYLLTVLKLGLLTVLLLISCGDSLRNFIKPYMYYFGDHLGAFIYDNIYFLVSLVLVSPDLIFNKKPKSYESFRASFISMYSVFLLSTIITLMRYPFIIPEFRVIVAIEAVVGGYLFLNILSVLIMALVTYMTKFKNKDDCVKEYENLVNKLDSLKSEIDTYENHLNEYKNFINSLKEIEEND